jgi:hypothetical protein
LGKVPLRKACRARDEVWLPHWIHNRKTNAMHLESSVSAGRIAEDLLKLSVRAQCHSYRMTYFRLCLHLLPNDGCNTLRTTSAVSQVPFYSPD